MKREDVTAEELELLEAIRAGAYSKNRPKERTPAESPLRACERLLRAGGRLYDLGTEPAGLLRQMADLEERYAPEINWRTTRTDAAEKIAKLLRDDLESSQALLCPSVVFWIQHRRLNLLDGTTDPEWYEAAWRDLETIAEGLVARPVISPKGGHPRQPPGIVKEEAYWEAHERRLAAIIEEAATRIRTTFGQDEIPDDAEGIHKALGVDDLDLFRFYQDQVEPGWENDDSFSCLFWQLEHPQTSIRAQRDFRDWSRVVSELVLLRLSDSRKTALSLARKALRSSRVK